jgi:catechol 2,3-dioxygenase-like lactoylglutathione lyase family enzyme
MKASRPAASFFLCLLLVSLSLVACQPAFAAEPPVRVYSVASVGFIVSDMDRSIAFYHDVLAFKPVSDVEVDGPEYDRLYGLFGVRARVVRMQLGEQQIELMQFLAPPDARPIPVPSYSHDLWFQHVAIVVRDMDAAWAQLKKHHVKQISPRPQTIPVSNLAAAGIKAIKFRDPDGHNLELLWFPDGKGHLRWHRAGSDLFMGIDHTALTVRSTENSLKFYRELLGLTVAGGTLNMGTEQEHLDGLPGARAWVTGLVPLLGLPGMEFLEYEAPASGRPFPADTHATDLWHWQTTLVLSDFAAVTTALQGHAQVVSTGVVTLPDNTRGFTKAIVVRDPDGHALRLIAP